MSDEKLYDITAVCNMFKTTSRTLRFYEEKGIIESTVILNSKRRHYTEEQVENIRNVFVLRTLGLSLKAISELQKNNIDLKSAVLSKRAEIYAYIEKRNREIALLNEALAIIESGENIFDMDFKYPSVSEQEKQIAEICSQAIVNGDTEILYNHLSKRMAQYMPEKVYEKIRQDTISQLGGFIGFDAVYADEQYSNKIYQLVKYSKLGLKITFVFHNKKIDGLWLSYYEMRQSL